MTITLHGIPNCDTVKKARAWLNGAGVSYSFRDYKKSPPSITELKGWVNVLDWERLLNTAGTTFRKLAENDRANLDEAKAIALMTAHPSLIKRPVITRDGSPVLLGFRPDDWTQELGPREK